MDIGRGMVENEDAFGLKQFIAIKKPTPNDKKRVKNATNAVLSKRRFIFRGQLEVRSAFCSVF